MREKNQLRQAVEEMLHPKAMKHNPFDYFITLTCGLPDSQRGFRGIELTVDEVSKKIRFMKNRLHKELFGRQPFGLNFVPSIETEEDLNKLNGRRTHAHLLCSHPDQESRLGRTSSKGLKEPFERLIRRFWKQSGFGSGIVDFRPYRNRNGASYICKEIRQVPTEIGTLFNADCIDWENIYLPEFVMLS
jgi:hypothetical protein